MLERVLRAVHGRVEQAGQKAPNLIVVFVFILAFALGLLVTFIGLRRAHMVPTWVLGAIVAAFAIEFAGPGGTAFAMVKQGLGLVAFAYLARFWWTTPELVLVAEPEPARAAQ